jgi:hypothetical protein
MLEQNLTVNSAAATPKGFEITVCDLTLNSGQVYDISNEVQDIKIHEGLYQSAFRVEIYIFDPYNMIHAFKLAGNEKINLLIERIDPISKEKGIKRKFDLEIYIAEIKDYSTPRPSAKGYTLECISKHVHLNNSQLLKTSFQGNTSKLIKNIVKSNLSSEVDIRATSKGNIKGIYPRISPLQGISWLLRNSYDNDTPFYFYESPSEGLVLTSYHEILKSKDKPHNTYNNYPMMQTSLLHGITESFKEEQQKIIKIVSHLNISKLGAALKGAFRSELHKIDISNKTVNKAEYKIKKDDSNTLNKFSSLNEKMKINNLPIQDYQNIKNYYISYNTSSFGSYDNYHKATDQSILKSQAHHHKLDTVKQEIVIPGDFTLSSGKIVELDLLKNADVTEEMVTNDTFKDTILSGKHLVTGIIHHFGKDGYQMNVILKKDSFIEEVLAKK